MLFDFENPIIGVSGVERLHWDGGVFDVEPRDYCALAFRMKGGAEIICQNEKYFVGENEVLYLPQKMGYHVEYSENELTVFHFETAYADTKPEIYSPSNSREIKSMFLKGYDIWDAKQAGYLADTVSLIYAILGLLCKKNAQANIPAHFSSAIEYINLNYKNSSLTIGEVCAAAGTSETMFRRLCKQYSKKTPTEYINELRLQNARSLIANGMSIEAAATGSGFNDPKYFARVVKKVYGCTPRQLKLFGR